MTHHMGMGGTVTTKAHTNAADDTPTKKLSRSPKPLTLLQAYDEAASRGVNGYDAREARRSSPGLFKASNNTKQPAGAAHAAARANRDANADPNATLLAFRERMRAAEASQPVQAATQQTRQRANSARRSRPVPPPRQTMVPAPPPPAASSRPVSRGGVAAARAASPRNTTRMDASIGVGGGAASARGGGGFRSRKYNQPGNNSGRINALISAR